MTNIKAYTDIEQSKKLAEILPIESSDCYWEDDISVEFGHGWHSQHFPCWSLAALLKVIPKHIKDYNVLRIDISENDTSIWYDEIGYGVNNDLPDITKDNPIDACYELILKLNELKML